MINITARQKPYTGFCEKKIQIKKRRRVKKKLLQCLKYLQQEQNSKKEYALLIDGESLKFAIEYYKNMLLQLVTFCKSAICSRITPNQKVFLNNNLTFFFRHL